MPEHLKNKAELASNNYGISQSEFIKDAIKEKLMQYKKIKALLECFLMIIIGKYKMIYKERITKQGKIIKEVKKGVDHYRFYRINDKIKKEAFIMRVELK